MRSAVWRLWVEGSEIYLAGRTAVAVYKLSLHSSGKWRLAWTKELKEQESEDRVLMRWERPAASNGWVQGPSVAIPAPQFPDLLDSGAMLDLKDVILVADPKADSCGFFTVWISLPDVGLEEWQAEARGGRRLLGTLPLANRETVGILWSEVPHTERDQSYLSQLRREAPKVPTDIPPEHIFLNMVHFGTDDTGRPVLCDLVLGREHLVPLGSGNR